MPWRVGRHYGIHVYDGDRPVATFHDPKEALRAVEAVNRELGEQLEHERPSQDDGSMCE